MQDDILYPVPDEVVFKDCKQHKVGAIISRRLLLRSSDILKNDVCVKILQPRIHECFRVDIDDDGEKKNTIQVIVHLIVPDERQNLQDWIRISCPELKALLLIPLKAIFTLPDDKFVPPAPPRALLLNSDLNDVQYELKAKLSACLLDENEDEGSYHHDGKTSKQRLWTEDELRHYEEIIAAESALKQPTKKATRQGGEEELAFYRQQLEQSQTDPRHLPATQGKGVKVVGDVFLVDGVWVDAMGREVLGADGGVIEESAERRGAEPAQVR